MTARVMDQAAAGKPFVPVSWEVALDLAAEALQRTRKEYGNESIFGGSYGWASAGRFHHSQGQLHRFLNCFGGYTGSVNSYSTAAAQVIMQHVLAIDYTSMFLQAPTPEDMARHTKTLLLFGGAAIKNAQVNAGGIGEHTARKQLQKLRDAGVDVINVSPVRDDTGDFLEAKWVPCQPGSDVAIMLGHIGLPGGGVAYGYGCIHNIGFVGRKTPTWSMGALPQGDNPVKSFIPVARITDLLNHPGGTVDFNVFGHIADGNLHLFIQPNEEGDHHGECDTIVYGCLDGFEGSVSAEHGIGIEKKHWLKASRTAKEIALMKTLKQAMDPGNLLNPGKLFE